MKIQNGIAIVCFFLSGFAGLVYEVSWIRKASLVFGSTTFAVSTVLAVFFSRTGLRKLPVWTNWSKNIATIEALRTDRSGTWAVRHGKSLPP
jgi:predicted membrane-bound spermidine synthase